MEQERFMVIDNQKGVVIPLQADKTISIERIKNTNINDGKDEELEERLKEIDELYDLSNSEPVTPMWQQMKEEQYAKLNVTVKQLDIIIGICVAGLIILAIVIGLDATGII